MPQTCHTPQELERLLGSALPPADAESLARHIEQCDRCAAVVDTLLDGGSLTALVREQAKAGEPTTDPHVAYLIRRLRDLKAGDTAGTQATSSPDAHTLPPAR